MEIWENIGLVENTILFNFHAFLTFLKIVQSMSKTSKVSSFLSQDISSMKNVITRVKGSQPAPILLVANKFDLDCQREVSTAEGKYPFYIILKPYWNYKWAYFISSFKKEKTKS